MREKIADWGEKLQKLVAAERGEARFKDCLKPNEYVHVFGHDSSMLEIVLERGRGIYRLNQYTRIIWSERNSPETPFTYKSYEYSPDLEKDPDADPGKPKQAFYDDKDFKPELLTALAVEEILFNPVSVGIIVGITLGEAIDQLPYRDLPKLELRGHPPSHLQLGRLKLDGEDNDECSD